MRLGGQPFEIVDEADARVLRVLVVHADVNRFFRADFLAIAAKDAAKLIDLVNQRIAMALLVFSRHELDAVRGTDLRAQPAGDALRSALLVGQHAMRAAPARRKRPVLGGLLLGILHRDLGSQQMAERQRHPLERRAQIRGLPGRPLHDFHADRHYAASCGIEPETIRPRSSHQTSAMSITRFRPPKAQAMPGPYPQLSRTRTNQ